MTKTEIGCDYFMTRESRKTESIPLRRDELSVLFVNAFVSSVILIFSYYKIRTFIYFYNQRDWQPSGRSC